MYPSKKNKPTITLPTQLFALRTPLLPLSYLLNLSWKKVENTYQNPLLQEALFIASPELFERYQALQSGQVSEKDQKRIQIALTKYLIRGAYRATPFGLFASVALGSFTKDAQVSLSNISQAELIRKTRPDTSYFNHLIYLIDEAEELRDLFLKKYQFFH